MPTLFFLANPKLEKTSIDMIVRFRKVRYKRSTGVSVVTKFWNAERQLSSVTKQYRDGVSINYKLTEWKNAIDRLLFNLEERQIPIINSDHFWQLAACERAAKPYEDFAGRTNLFTDYFRSVYVPRFIRLKTESRIARLKLILQVLTNYENDRSIRLTFGDINVTFYRDITLWASEKKYSQNYLASIIKIVKQVMREAMNIDKLHSNPEFTTFKSAGKEIDSVYLTVDELKRIHDTPIDDEFVRQLHPGATPFTANHIKHSYNIVKNRFLLGAFTGLRVSDFNRLRKENIADDRIQMITKKTGEKVTIPIHPIVREIIDSGFSFTESLSEQKTRDYIKTICRCVGIRDVIEIHSSAIGSAPTERYEKWQLVGTHTARRSFATNAYKAGIPAIAIMKITGHKSERTFLKYIRISKEENADMLSRSDFFSK